jgi:acyl-CoA reductase-like NAD-dependent aldehyde dehydrogenase
MPTQSIESRSPSIESRSPQDPSDVVITVPDADREAVGRAVERARAAARDWATTPAVQRAAALTSAAQALADAHAEVTRLVVREVGKPVTESGQEVTRGVGILRYHAQAALDPDGETYPPGPPADRTSLLLARRRPRGVAGLVTPWNFPVAIPLWKAAPALAYGNAAVLKPAPESSALGVRLAELLGEFLPEGVFQVVTGGAEAGRALVDLADVVSFTGSVGAGFSVAQAAAGRGIPVQAEMGGQNASIVLPDADPEATAATVAAAAMGYAGQKCTATSRVIVVGEPGGFTDALVAAVEGLGRGDPADEGVAVGPVIRPDARDKVLAAAQEARGLGGQVVTGGRAGDGAGWFVAPTVVDGLGPEARLAQEEVFGPICAVLRAGSADEAVAISNGVPYGLVTSVFTGDLGAALRLVDALDTGLVRVNQPTSGVDFHAPFGGEKQSSIGPREQGKQARELYTSSRTVTIAPPPGA